MKFKLLLFVLVIIAILFSCSGEKFPNVKPQLKDTLITDSVKTDSTKSYQDSLDWDHLENVASKVYQFSTDLVPVYEGSYNNIFIGNILYIDASTLQELKFVSNIKYIEKLDLCCEYNADNYFATEFPSYEVTHNLIDKLTNDAVGNGEFKTSSPVKLKSLKALHFYSEAKIGMPLDEVFYPDGYKNHTDDNRRFQLYTLYQKIGQILMDYPMGKLISNEFTNKEKDNMAIINNINIGRIAYMITDSKYNCVIITFTSNGKPIIQRGGGEFKSSFSKLFNQQKSRLIDFNIQRISDYFITELRYHVDMR